MKPRLYGTEILEPRSISIPSAHRRVLLVLGNGNISEGIRILVETHMQKELEEDRIICEDLRNSNAEWSRVALGNLTSVSKKRGSVLREEERKGDVGG